MSPLPQRRSRLHADSPPQLLLFGEALPQGPARRSMGVAPRAAAKAEPSPCAAAEHRALRQAYVGLVTRWALSAREALCLLGEPLAGEEERRERLSALVGLGRSLVALEPHPERGPHHLRAPCPALDGASPLELMLSHGLPAIREVRALWLSKRHRRRPFDHAGPLHSTAPDLWLTVACQHASTLACVSAKCTLPTWPETAWSSIRS